MKNKEIRLGIGSSWVIRQAVNVTWFPKNGIRWSGE